MVVVLLSLLCGQLAVFLVAVQVLGWVCRDCREGGEGVNGEGGPFIFIHSTRHAVQWGSHLSHPAVPLPVAVSRWKASANLRNGAQNVREPHETSRPLSITILPPPWSICFLLIFTNSPLMLFPGGPLPQSSITGGILGCRRRGKKVKLHWYTSLSAVEITAKSKPTFYPHPVNPTKNSRPRNLK